MDLLDGDSRGETNVSVNTIFYTKCITYHPQWLFIFQDCVSLTSENSVCLLPPQCCKESLKSGKLLSSF